MCGPSFMLGNNTPYFIGSSHSIMDVQEHQHLKNSCNTRWKVPDKGDDR
ncbi:hypothetical protein JL09_g5666 [Pichia kudriavzevii]|uniref:Uncharacterized protein n=1 Tax=Pichia kudriavzevii TaxID=4909 RepID=A0A099NT22_PICKU|nr:hypothetical protein JL09_g5666 [Pichia kudriavzevii]